MPRFLKSDGDVVTVPDALVEVYEARGHERIVDGSPEELRGAALDEALDEAALPKTGTADEKRRRYAEHLQNPTE